jgi:WD40 repeat protein
VAGKEGLVRLFGPGLEPLGTLGTSGPAISALAYDPASGRLAAAAADGTLSIHPGGARTEPQRLRAHRDGFGLEWSPSGGHLVTHGTDGQALLWSTSGDGLATALEGPSILAAAFTPDGSRVVTRASDGTLRVWPLNGIGARGLFARHQGVIDTVVWSRDGRRLLTASHDGKARVLDRATGGVLSTLLDPAGIIHSAAWDPAERRILTASEDGTARIWSAEDGALLTALPAAGAPILFAAWSPDGLTVATAGLDGIIRLHRADGRGEPRRLEGHEVGVTHVVFSPDGATLVSASQLDATVRLWPLDGGAPRVLRADRAVYRAGLSPRGDLLAVAELDGPVRLFRAADLSELPPLRAWPARLWSSAWSPDQRRLALASFDGTVRVVALDDTGEPLLVRGPPSAVSEVAFSPSGRELAVASADGALRIAAVDWPLQRQRLAAATSACLTASQRLHLLGEAEDEAQSRYAECERRHQREPGVSDQPGPALPVTAAVPAASRAAERTSP